MVTTPLMSEGLAVLLGRGGGGRGVQWLQHHSCQGFGSFVGLEILCVGGGGGGGGMQWLQHDLHIYIWSKYALIFTVISTADNEFLVASEYFACFSPAEMRTCSQYIIIFKCFRTLFNIISFLSLPLCLLFLFLFDSCTFVVLIMVVGSQWSIFMFV